MELLRVLFLISIITTSSQNERVPVSVTRTEIKVSRSLNPDDMQTLNVMTKDGNIAQLIVKRRDGKSRLPENQSIMKDNYSSQDQRKLQGSQYTRAIYTNWIPLSSSVYYTPKIITLDSLALVRNASEEKLFNNNLGNVIDSDRIPHVPKPVTIKSEEVFVKNSDKKRGRSVLKIGRDGIPEVHGVRVPDDESDRKVWRNARVINGELVPYEKGYKPPPAAPLGQLVYASQMSTSKDDDLKSVGPFSKEDNFRIENHKQHFKGPFTIKDNVEIEHSDEAKISYGGPFTKADNAKLSGGKLIDYIKEINAKESKKDYFNRRRYRAYDSENNSQQFQRRMLQYPGQNSYPNSALYTPQSAKMSSVSFNEGVRTPVLQYAHPELGVQPAKATREGDEDYTKSENQESYSKYNSVNSGRQNQYFPNRVDYYKKDVLNYPYNTYYISKPKAEQPFWIKISESIKDNVQNGIERMQQLTRPVFEPLVEASHKISHNLGFSTGDSPQRAQDKIGFAAPIGGSVILPALGLVAGGAALGLGAAAVGRYLNPEEMRSLHGVEQKDILFIMEEPINDEKSQGRFKRGLDENLYLQGIIDSINNDIYGQTHLTRVKRNVESSYNMQTLDMNIGDNSKLSKLSAPHYWSDTPCSKRIFCEVMVTQKPDEILLMEKKIDSLLLRIHPDIVNTVAHHLQDVMTSVKQGSCLHYVCNKQIPYYAPAA